MNVNNASIERLSFRGDLEVRLVTTIATCVKDGIPIFMG